MQARLETAGANPGVASGAGRWRALPFFAIRQAGFPFSWLTELASADAAAEASALLDVWVGLERSLAVFHGALRSMGRSSDGISSKVGRQVAKVRLHLDRGQQVEEERITALSERPEGAGLTVLRTNWNAAVTALHEARARFESTYQRSLVVAGGAVVERFRSERLRNVLLISNHSNYALFEEFLGRPLVATSH